MRAMWRAVRYSLSFNMKELEAVFALLSNVMPYIDYGIGLLLRFLVFGAFLKGLVSKTDFSVSSVGVSMPDV